MLNISKKSLIFLLFYSSHLFAQEYSFNGHLKTINSFTRYSSDDSQSQFDLKDSFRSDLNSRLNSQITEDAFKFVLQGDFVASGIENIAKQKKISDQFAPGISRQFFISDDSQFFDFSKTISEDGDVFTNLRLDRVFLHYEHGKFSTDIGRQALSWGQGIVFQSLDVFNPFAPASIDTEYKTGQDMALISYSYDLNTQINALLVPRRDVISHDFESDKSSFVLRVQKRFEGTSYETQAIIAKHFDEPMIGLGISTTLLESVIRFDFALFDPDQGNLIPQAIINMDRSWEAFGINWYGYLEYFYSGSGTSSSNYSDLSERLLKKLEQGELFTLAENYLTTGFKQEITPLINLYELVILNLDDNSTLSQLKLTYDLTPNFTILSALTFGLGASGDEFQSLKLLNGGLLGRGDSFLLQGNYYF